jgi:hypothetical protein
MIDDVPIPFQTGAITGGESSARTLFEPVHKSLVGFWSKTLTANLGSLGGQEAGINLIFHLSGEFLKADEFVLRTGSFLKKLRIQIVQARIPDDVETADDVRLVVISALRKSGPEVVEYFRRRKIDFSVERSLVCLGEAALFLEGQLDNGKGGNTP